MGGERGEAMLLSGVVRIETVKPRVEVADVFRRWWDEYCRTHRVSERERKIAWHIMSCRTAALGGYIEICEECEKIIGHYCSCKDRHCPKCQGYEKACWLAEQAEKMLPVTYYHVVFTTDHALNELARKNKPAIYNLLFDAASEVLKEFGRKYLGGEIGITAVLHTWGQTLNGHIHLHCIVTGGALQRTAEGEKWQSSGKGFLFPVVALSAAFRERFCAGLLKLERAGRLDSRGIDVGALAAEMRGKKWEVFIRAAFDDPQKLYDYLAKYIYRIAISNHRLVKIERGKVYFRYHDNKDGGREKVMALDGVEFIRRYLLHVLPSRFVRVRHYGLHHTSRKGALERIRALLGEAQTKVEAAKPEFGEWVKSWSGQDPRVCPFCGKGRLVRYRDFGPVTGLRAKILELLGIPLRGRVAA